MSNFNPTAHVRNLHAEATNVMQQIRAAEGGNRLEYEQFCSLLRRKNAAVTEANRIISEVNHTLNIAASCPSERLPPSQYRELCNARRIAREIIQLVRTPRTSIQKKTEQVSTTTDVSELKFSDLVYDDEDAVLPF